MADENDAPAPDAEARPDTHFELFAAAPVQEPDAAAAEDAHPLAPEPRVTLDEFCADLSRTSRRYTLISAFHFVEDQAGRRSDTEAAYRDRFAALARQPA
jgi:hypothetical protein